MEFREDLGFITAVCGRGANIVILLGMLRLFALPGHSLRFDYLMATSATLLITLICSVAVPQAAARYAGAKIVGACAAFLQMLRLAMLPVTKIMHGIDNLFRRLTGASNEPEADEIEQEILSVVEEGEKEGVVDEE